MTSSIRRKLGQKVAPRSRESIQEAAVRLRQMFETVFNDIVDQRGKLNITWLIERLQERGHLECHIVENDQLPGCGARAFPDQSLIIVREDVWNNACDGDGHCRFTLAHELGHIDLHRNQFITPTFARGDIPQHLIYQDSEWQADEFASEFLVPSYFIDQNSSVQHICERFGVSRTAALMKLNILKKMVS